MPLILLYTFRLSCYPTACLICVCLLSVNLYISQCVYVSARPFTHLSRFHFVSQCFACLFIYPSKLSMLSYTVSSICLSLNLSVWHLPISPFVWPSVCLTSFQSCYQPFFKIRRLPLVTSLRHSSMVTVHVFKKSKNRKERKKRKTISNESFIK